MGDRANVFVREQYGDDEQRRQGVYLYTHWSGYELPFTVQEALKRRLRWNDGAYLARIVFCEMVRGSEREETGYGISTRMCDNEHAIVVLDPQAQTVAFVPAGEERDIDGHDEAFVWSMEDYIGLDEETIRVRYQAAAG